MEQPISDHGLAAPAAVTATVRVPTLVVTLAGGGWHLETVRILERLGADDFAYVYVGGAFTNPRTNTVPAPHAGRRIAWPQMGQTRGRPLRPLLNVFRLAAVFCRAVGLVYRLRPRGILSLGTPNAVPLFLVGRLFGVRCIFVESLTRVRDLSRTAKLLYHLRLANRLYVQWPGLAQRYPRAVFAGAIV
jgi:UDP-N-acetylglucosamine:LPS N-acetylglucosamine transferase